ncbi:MAG TPA: hypothetical protein VKH35_15885, partial [Thermoanaerobaculia bacterium]|nr:hypothetical protein [Thermoanaerobaculia bacterium]
MLLLLRIETYEIDQPPDVERALIEGRPRSGVDAVFFPRGVDSDEAHVRERALGIAGLQEHSVCHEGPCVTPRRDESGIHEDEVEKKDGHATAPACFVACQPNGADNRQKEEKCKEIGDLAHRESVERFGRGITRPAERRSLSPPRN